MATREMFSTTDLLAPLAERGIKLSSAQVYRLVVDRPERLSLKILMALLDILDCTMEKLIEPMPVAGQTKKTKVVGGETGVGELRPKRGPHRTRRRMSAVLQAEATADLIGLVVRLVTGIEPTPTAEAVRQEVAKVAGGRAKSRRLAQNLLTDPRLLISGRPPVPWSVGQLLLGLRAAGATAIAAPRCGECGRGCLVPDQPEGVRDLLALPGQARDLRQVRGAGPHTGPNRAVRAQSEVSSSCAVRL